MNQPPPPLSVNRNIILTALDGTIARVAVPAPLDAFAVLGEGSSRTVVDDSGDNGGAIHLLDPGDVL